MRFEWDVFWFCGRNNQRSQTSRSLNELISLTNYDIVYSIESPDFVLIRSDSVPFCKQLSTNQHIQDKRKLRSAILPVLAACGRVCMCQQVLPCVYLTVRHPSTMTRDDPNFLFFKHFLPFYLLQEPSRKLSASWNMSLLSIQLRMSVEKGVLMAWSYSIKLLCAWQCAQSEDSLLMKLNYKFTSSLTQVALLQSKPQSITSDGM